MFEQISAYSDDGGVDINCIWIITSPEQHTIELNLTSLEFSFPNNCTQNSIRVIYLISYHNVIFRMHH